MERFHVNEFKKSEFTNLLSMQQSYMIVFFVSRKKHLPLPG